MMQSNQTTSRPSNIFVRPLRSVWCYRLIRYALAAVFIYAGGIKLLDPDSFEVVIAGYGLVPSPWLPFVAVTLPALEVLAGIGLILDVAGSLITVLLLLLFFIAILWYGQHLGLDVDCGCYGPEDPEAAYHDLSSAMWRDVALLGLVAYGYWWRKMFRPRLLNPVSVVFRQKRP